VRPLREERAFLAGEYEARFTDFHTAAIGKRSPAKRDVVESLVRAIATSKFGDHPERSATNKSQPYSRCFHCELW